VERDWAKKICASVGSFQYSEAVVRVELPVNSELALYWAP